MTNAKSTKRALLTSVMALILCFTMLLGTTFAWFTDSVTSANNVIKSGNLDIELEYAVFNDDDTFKEWKDVKDASDILTHELWEPGVTEVAYLRVSNAGSLVLKYQLGINILDEIAGKNQANETFKLSDYIMFGVVEDVNGEKDAYTKDDAGRAAAIADVTDAKKISAGYTKSSTMAPNDVLYLALVVYMPTSVGNVANHNGTDVPQIDLGINVLATQMTAESDSFDDKYDADAWMPGMLVYSAEDLSAALTNGGNVTLGADVAVAERVEIPEGVEVTLNMNGYELSTTGGIALYNQGDLTITGEGKISSVSGYAICVQSGSLVIDSADITVSSQFGAVSVFNGADVTINGGNFYNTGYNAHTSHTIYVGGYGTLNINDGTFNSGYSNDGIDTICGYGWENSANEKAVINLNGGTFYPSELNGSSFFISNYDSSWTEINIKGGTYSTYDPSKISGTKIAEGYKSIDNGDGTWTVLFPQESVNDLFANPENNTVQLPAGEFTMPTLADKDGLTVVGAEDGSTVIGGEDATTGFSKNFGKDTTIKNITFSGSDNGVRWSYAKGGDTTFDNCTFAGDSVYGFHIDESEGANFTFNNCTFIGFNAFAGDLASVTFNNCTFLSNGNYGHTNIWSYGYFNNCTWGDNTSVSPGSGGGNLYFNGVEESYHHEFIGSAESLFAFAESVNEGGDSWSGQKVLLVADIDLENKSWTPIGQTGATEFRGIFDGQNYTIKNLYVDNTSYTDEHTSTGLFGWAESGVTIQNVKVDGATMKGNHNVAVIVGYTYSGKITNCHVSNATVVCTHANDEACGDKAGIIAGYTADEARLTDCTASDSTVTAGRDAGQLFGLAYTNSVSNCSATNVVVSATGDCNDEKNINNAVIGRVMG